MSTSGSMGAFLKYNSRICFLPLMSGKGTLTCLSKRPGRRRASSSDWGKLVAPMMMMPWWGDTSRQADRKNRQDRQTETRKAGGERRSESIDNTYMEGNPYVHFTALNRQAWLLPCFVRSRPAPPAAGSTSSSSPIPWTPRSNTYHSARNGEGTGH